MTVSDVKRIALQLANTYWVRYYLCLNYPQEPQAVCITLHDHEARTIDERSHRGDLLMREMEKLGFTWDIKYGIVGFHAIVDRSTQNCTDDDSAAPEKLPSTKAGS